MRRRLGKVVGALATVCLAAIAVQSPASATAEWVTTSVGGTVIALGAGNGGTLNDNLYVFYAQDLGSTNYCATTQFNLGSGWEYAAHDCSNDGVGKSVEWFISNPAVFVRICQSLASKPTTDIFNCGAARAVYDDQ